MVSRAFFPRGLMALNREQRRALLKGELDGVDTDATDVDTYEAPPAPAPAVAPVAPAVALSQEQFAALLAAIGGGGASSSGIGAQIAEALKANRQPIPENPPDQYHAASIYHPDGKDAPLVPLKADMYLGTWDAEKGKAVPGFPIHSEMLTDAEREALNRVEPGARTVQMTDGTQVPIRVVAQEDAMGVLARMVFAFPPSTFSKDRRNMIPNYVALAAQLTSVA